MLKLYHAGMTRSVRVRWPLEEQGLDYELVRSDFKPPSGGWYAQKTPLGKFPVIEDAKVRARSALDFLEREMGQPWVLGEAFSAADVMLGYTLAVARFTKLLDGYEKLGSYLARLEARPAYQRATAD